VPDVAEVAEGSAAAARDLAEWPVERDVIEGSSGNGLWQAVQALPPRQRAAVVHRFVLDRTYREIAESMGSTEETARANVSQAVRKLRAQQESWREGV
jgi:RNA polymerase sigma factor (sigma-70 family)